MASISVELVIRELWINLLKRRTIYFRLSPFLIYLLYKRKEERGWVVDNVAILHENKYLYVLSRYNLLEYCWKAIFLVKFTLSTICRMYHVWMYWNATIVSCGSLYKKTLDSERYKERDAKIDITYIVRIALSGTFENNSHFVWRKKTTSNVNILF